MDRVKDAAKGALAKGESAKSGLSGGGWRGSDGKPRERWRDKGMNQVVRYLLEL